MELEDAELKKHDQKRAMMETCTQMNLLGTAQSPGDSKFKSLVHDIVSKRKGTGAEKQLSHEQRMRELSKVMSARNTSVGNMNQPNTYKRVDLGPVLAN